MRKVRCSYCGEIFSVEEEKETIYCPKCFKELSFKQAKKNLGSYIGRTFNNALIELNEATEYENAAKHFQIVLDVYPNDVGAAKGLVISTLLMSTVRQSYIKESLDNLNRYKDTLEINNLSLEDTYKFVDKINDYLKLYVTTLKQRLSDDNHFYEQKGYDIYINAVNDVIDYENSLINLYFSKRKLPHEPSLNKEIIENNIKILKKELKNKYSIETSPLHKLDSEVKECYIEDIIFADNSHLFKLKNNYLICFISFFLLFIIGIILIFALPNRLLIGVPITCVGLFLATLFFLLDINVIKKLSQ